MFNFKEPKYISLNYPYNQKTNMQEKTNIWWQKIKISLCILVGIAIYAYIIILAKTFYIKTQRLARIEAMTLEAEELIRDIHVLDQNIANQIKYLRSLESYDDN